MSFPEAFARRVTNDPFLGEALLDALDADVPVSVRFNPTKTAPELSIKSTIPWCENAFYLNERPQFTLDPLFHAGCYYPQEAGSMVLDLVLRHLEIPENPAMLDLCGAPGGKSTLIASYLSGKGFLVSNEVIHARSRILKENMTKWGCSNSIVTNNDPRDFDRLPDFFDVIVVDAPCSGEGMFRKDPDSRNEWSEEAVLMCSARQKRIVADVWTALKPGGFLIYSTCTFNEQENEQNVTFMCEDLGAELLELAIPSPIQKGRKGIGYYCIPGITETEGFFIAVLQKEADKTARIKWETKKDMRKTSLDPQVYTKTEGSVFYQWNELIMAFPIETNEQMQHVVAQMRIVKAGTVIGELQRKGMNPHEELAFNPSLLQYPERIDLSKEKALHYLHGDTFPLEGKHGFQLITYKSEPLGWIKHLGNRFNNLYPKEWRIRMKIE